MTSPQCSFHEQVAGGIPTWAMPAQPESFFALLQSDELTDEELNVLLDAAGPVPDDIDTLHWRELRQRVDPRPEAAHTVHARLPEHVIRTLLCPVWALLFKSVRDVHTAEDLAQETFLKADAAWDQFDSAKGRAPEYNEKVKRWIFTIAINVVRDWIRRPQQPFPWNPQQLQQRTAAPVESDPPHAGGMSSESMLSLHDALDRLTERDRLVLSDLAHDVEAGRTAERLGTTPGAIYVARNRAKQRIREAIGRGCAGNGSDPDDATTT